MQSINKNYDSGQDSVLFFQGKEYKLTTLKSFERDRTFPEEKLILELSKSDLESGLSLNSAGVYIDFDTYRDFMANFSSHSKLLFLQIKRKVELQIWKSELCNTPNIFPVITEFKTDWIKSILLEKTPVLFEVKRMMKFPSFVSGFVMRKSNEKVSTEIENLREQLRKNQLLLLNSLSERRRIIEELKDIKKKKGLDVYQSDVFLNNLLFSFDDAEANKLPLNDVMDLYLFLHDISVQQQERIS